MAALAGVDPGVGALAADVAALAEAAAAPPAVPATHRFVHSAELVTPRAVADHQREIVTAVSESAMIPMSMSPVSMRRRRRRRRHQELHVVLALRPDPARCALGYAGCEFVCVIQYAKAERYPNTAMPRVSFTSILVHYALDPHTFSLKEDQAAYVSNVLLSRLATSSPFSVPNLVQLLEEVFFNQALHPCENCTPAFEQHAYMHFHAYVNLVRKYHHLRSRNPFQNALFGADAHGWPREWFDPSFYDAVILCGANDKAAVRDFVQATECAGVYSFPMFTAAFCDGMLQELDEYSRSGLPCPRPNSMNNHGLILNGIGLEGTFTRLQRDVLQIVSAALYPEEGTSLDTHHTFLVQYKPGEDLGLDMHTDDSDVTFNICLGRQFEGANLEFCGRFGAEDHRKHTYTHAHVRGACVVHVGRQRHGARCIETGERVNLIVWNRSLPFRSLEKSLHLRSQYAKESGAPDVVCLSRTHDRDYALYEGVAGVGEHSVLADVTEDEAEQSKSKLCSSGGGSKTQKGGPERNGRRQESAWCPPEGKEHDGSPLCVN